MIKVLLRSIHHQQLNLPLYKDQITGMASIYKKIYIQLLIRLVWKSLLSCKEMIDRV